MLTYKELHTQLMYNPWNGNFYRKCPSKFSTAKYGDIAGGINKTTGYVEISINCEKYYGHRLAWFYVYGYMPENIIDHKKQIRHHNWISNLREVSTQCNLRNTGNPKNSTSRVKGVSWNKKGKKWKAHIAVQYANKYLGQYKNFDNAVCARLAGEQCLEWEGCDSNSPAYLYVKNNI